MEHELKHIDAVVDISVLAVTSQRLNLAVVLEAILESLGSSKF